MLRLLFFVPAERWMANHPRQTYARGHCGHCNKSRAVDVASVFIDLCSGFRSPGHEAASGAVSPVWLVEQT